MSMELAAQSGPSDYEKREKKITCLADAQRLLGTLEEKEYSDEVIKAAKDLVKTIAMSDASRYDVDMESDIEEDDDEDEEEEDDYEDMSAVEMGKKLKKKGIIASIEKN